MESGTISPGRLAIRCIRPDLTGDRNRDEQQMTEIGVLLGYAVDEVVVVLDPSREWPLITIENALNRTKADAVIVPDLEHIDGLERPIRERAQLITVEGEKILERAGLTAELAQAARADTT
ncbi:hypothetical protein [Nocardia wallacei]|uniref:hypothetical protein n=1 Tax=Nocardia wallacei TaxID=480035 RepID=UPI0024573C16|nr:hypothetical protein [Nocardia wallacei]